MALGVVTFALNGRLSLFSMKWGNKSTQIEADKQNPGVDLEGVDAVRDVNAKDETSKGIRAKKVTVGRDGTFTNQASPKL